MPQPASALLPGELPSPGRSAPSVWLQSLRLYATSASVIPVLLGVVLAWPGRDGAGAYLWVLALVGAVFLHLGTNLLNDLGDFRSGVDKVGISEGSGVLTTRLLSERQVATAGYLCLLAGSALGLPVVLARGWPVLGLGAIGVLGGWGYTLGPRYKYLGLGDVCVFLLMGPLMVLGGALAVAGTLSPGLALASLPVGLLVVGILHANNLRDLEADAASGIHTLARLLGQSRSVAYFKLLIFGAYAALGALCAARELPLGALAAVLTLPLGIKLVSKAAAARSIESRRTANLVEETAKLHMAFGLLMVIGAGATRFFTP